MGLGPQDHPTDPFTAPRPRPLCPFWLAFRKAPETSAGRPRLAAVPTLLRASLKSRTKSSIMGAVYTPASSQASPLRQWSTVASALLRTRERKHRAVCFTDLLSSWGDTANPLTQTHSCLQLPRGYTSEPRARRPRETTETRRGEVAPPAGAGEVLTDGGVQSVVSISGSSPVVSLP